MRTTKKDIGNLGEKIAKNYLEKNGFTILEVNFRYSNKGEIDIIAQKSQTLHFCEVKTRSGLGYGYPEEAVGQKKLDRINQTAWFYTKRNSLHKLDRQVDIISITLNHKTRRARLEHIQNFGYK